MLLNHRALARILKLPVSFERAPVMKKEEEKKKDTVGETDVERALACEPQQRGVQGQRPGGGPGGRAPASSGVLAISNVLGEPSWTLISNPSK